MPKEDTQFKPNNNANPEGRPKGSFSILTILKKKLQECPSGEDKRTYAERIVEKLLEDAEKKGDTQMRKIIFNYIEGMPAQAMDVTSKGEKLFIQISKEIADKNDINTESDNNSQG